jgi:hypothetical protein
MPEYKTSIVSDYTVSLSTSLPDFIPGCAPQLPQQSRRKVNLPHLYEAP